MSINADRQHLNTCCNFDITKHFIISIEITLFKRFIFSVHNTA